MANMSVFLCEQVFPMQSSFLRVTIFYSIYDHLMRFALLLFNNIFIHFIKIDVVKTHAATQEISEKNQFLGKIVNEDFFSTLRKKKKTQLINISKIVLTKNVSSQLFKQR